MSRRSGHRFGEKGMRQCMILEHDPEKWEPVFGKDHAQIKKRAPIPQERDAL
jgi:hypothetical protein